MKSINLIIMLLLSAVALAQKSPVSGFVLDEQELPLAGANVYWSETTIGTTTNQKGAFILEQPNKGLPSKLVASYIGYKSDTILVSGTMMPISLQLKINNQLETIEIESKINSTSTSTINPIQTIKINSAELAKAACCNLAESFETNNTVDVGASDAVSGAMKLQMLGLDGQYVWMMQENLPGMNGLAVNAGLGLIPGPWLSSIEIAKGTGSVAHGYGGQTGSINVELLKPESAPKFFLNLYGSQMGRFEGNIHLKHAISPKTTGLWLIHGNIMESYWDMNHDHFADMPLSKQLNIMNRWQFKPNERWAAQAAVQILTDSKRGGQQVASHNGVSHEPFRIAIDTRRYEAWGKLARLFKEKPTRGLGFLAKSIRHEQEAQFGQKYYQGRQTGIYFNSVFQDIISTTNHQYKIGASIQAEQFEELLLQPNGVDTLLNRKEFVPGVYGEYTFTGKRNWQLVSGLRLDLHNQFGLQTTPRVHIKLPISDQQVVRFAFGTGFRVANPFSENQAALASSRMIIISEKLEPEKTSTVGLSYTLQAKLFGKPIQLDVDGYYTHFRNQLIVDWENPRQLVFYNLQGISYALSAQIDVNYEILERLDFRLSYRADDVRSTYSNNLLLKPFVARNKVLFNLAYATFYDKWKFDFTGQYFGVKRIPETVLNPEIDQRRPNQSPSFWLFNAQVTKKFKHWELYFGGENIFNFTQPNPIIDAQNPFGTYFDASLIWAPVFGGRYYTGIRITIN